MDPRGLLILVTSLICFGTDYIYAQKSLQSQRITETIVLDGILSENCWQNAPAADSFIINYPTPGKPAGCRTVVRMVYDEQAVYFGAELQDEAPDSILAILSQRDDFGNADWFGVTIDPYGAGQNGFGFYVTAAGVELDAIINQDGPDYSWNSVWKSRVWRTSTGWSAEMRIPLSQLRFPEKEIQTWKVNFKRQVRRRRETSYWTEVDPLKYGEITQSGSVEGLSGLRSPLRLSFSPYATTYLENYYDDQSASQEWRFRQRFGMDMKYGLSESFTLDATLVPDFGQTASDRLVLNLSPFEIRYNENRPFFLEGMDLFGIGDLFYTRRIGGPTFKGGFLVDSLQQTGNTVESAASQAQLINATKISGRTKKGLGIGIFNAIEGRSYITYKDSAGNSREMLAHPVTNYNVFVLSQNLKNNGNISLLNTNVYRPEIKQFANVTAAETRLLTKNRKYSVFLSGKGSVVENQLGSTTFGHSLYSVFERVAGAVNYSFEYYEMSDSFDPNDLGYLERNNMRGASTQLIWNGYQPKGRFLRRSVQISSNLEYLYNPSKYAFWSINASTFGTFRNFLSCEVSTDILPLGEVAWFESRVSGRPVNLPASASFGGFYSSDYSKKYALDFSVYDRVYDAKGMNNIDAEISPRVRFSNRLFMVVSTGVSRYRNNYGYVHVTDTNYSNDIILGTRNRWIVNNSISADYTFTNRMGIVLRLNHYWQEVAYLGFRELENDGSLISSTYTGIDESGASRHNTTYNAFTVDLNFRWVIYPGSEVRFVWKYNIYASENGLDLQYFNTFKGLFDQPQLNSFSVKALFFLDAGRLKRMKN